MAEQTSKEVVIGSVETTNTFTNDHNLRSKICLPTSQGKGINIPIQFDTECNVPSRTNDFSDEPPATETSGRLSQETPTTTSNCTTPNSSNSNNLSSDEMKSKDIVVGTEDKENYIHAGVSDVDPSSEDSTCQVITETSSTDTPPTLTPSKQAEADDAETLRRAREEGRVEVVFPGLVTQEGCCRFVSEILKCILYQRQQLPMTYDQLVYSQKRQQAAMQNEAVVGWRPGQSAAEGLDWRRCQRTLQDLEEVLQQLEVLFSLSLVPRVLLLLGGSLLLPKELYEVNMEDVILAAGDLSLRVSSCLRQVFRTLFVADLLSDAKPVRLTATTVMVLAHRDCGVGWFRPKLNFKVPTRVKSQVISLSCDPSSVSESGTSEGGGQTDWQDYVWFQAPMAIKGFSK
ncbi:MAD2L1-binding protein isoform X3 [Coregonus clupeaformis]|uniref:MAD2L1-binding protein isoform X2 n=1 Tax=Coregonus clupeaformis TaxID=59861 RepID=UPI001BE04CF9|nr:MAD2L1-binding protein isoform X2 [Coregonus clupeaformis]XP_045078497.1 MAD2L1-binding protein isoform X3 [Coregonus clupeaformis]